MTCRQCGATLKAEELRKDDCPYCGSVLPHVAQAAQQVEVVKQMLADRDGNGIPDAFEGVVTGGARALAQPAIKVAKVGRRLAAVITLVILAMVIAPIVAVILSLRGVFMASQPGAAPKVTVNLPSFPGMPVAQPSQPPMSNFVDSARLATLMRSELPTSLKVFRMVVYPEYALVDAQNPADPYQVQMYLLRSGAIQSMTARPASSMESGAFPLKTLKINEVHRIAADAPKRVGRPNGRVTHMILQRNHQTDRLTWTVYVSEPRGSDFLAYSVEGKPLR